MMEQSEFLKSLIREKKIDESELQNCLYEGLIQKGYISKEAFKQLMEQFHQHEETQQSSHKKTTETDSGSVVSTPDSMTLIESQVETRPPSIETVFEPPNAESKVDTRPPSIETVFEPPNAESKVETRPPSLETVFEPPTIKRQIYPPPPMTAPMLPEEEHDTTSDQPQGHIVTEGGSGELLPEADTTQPGSFNTEFSHPTHDTMIDSQVALKIEWTDNDTDKERYSLLKTLGEGGMGVVQLVQDKLLGREVAQKKIKIQEEIFEEIPEMQQVMLWRLSREATLTALLEHPNIVPLYEIQTKKARELCFTMRKIEGLTLRELFKKQRANDWPVDENKILSIYLKICDAISYAHAKRIIHRDLKPDNIMIGEFGEVYVMDWGLAKRVDEEESEMIFSYRIESEIGTQGYQTVGGMGTPGYMPPEQEENASEVNIQADVYTLGKILKECYTRLSPIEEFKQKIEEDTRRRKVSKLINEQISESENEKPEEHNIPLDVLAIIHKATENEAEKRYQTVKDLSKDVERYLNHGRVSVREYTSWEILEKWLKRNKQQLSIIGIIVASIFLFALLTKWIDIKKRRREFQTILTQAQDIRKHATNILAQDKQARGQKIQQLIAALNALNKALALSTNHSIAESLKRDIGYELLELCFKSEDFQLAHYVAGDLQELSNLDSETKIKLKKRVTEEQFKTLAFHRSRLDFWVKELNQPALEKGVRENAIFEIARMPEPEIFEALKEIVKNGLTYFSQEEKRSTQENEFYLVMTSALGRMESPKAGPFFLRALKQMALKISSQPTTKRSVTDIQFMIHLAQGIAYTKPEKAIDTLRDIRDRMGQNGLFWYGTNLAYKTLLQQDNNSNKLISSASEYHQQGLKQHYQEQFKKAIEHFSEAIRLDPSRSEFYTSRGLSKLKIRALEEAILDFNEAIRLTPGEDIPYSNRGLARYNKKEYQKALQDYNIALQLNPNSVEAYNNRGLVHKRLKKYKEAIKDFDKALQINPQDAFAYLNRGHVNDLNGDINAALKDYEQAIQINPELSETYTNRAIIRQRIGNYSGALEDYNKTIFLNPKDYKAYYNRAATKEKLGDLKGALIDYDQTLTLNSEAAFAFFARGSTRKETGDFKGAIADYNEALRLEPGEGRYISYRGIAKYRQGKKKEAFEDCNKAIEMAPELAEAYFNRGVLRRDEKDLKSALSDYEKAIELKPQYAKAIAERGMIFDSQGEYKKALADFKLALSISPRLKEVYYNRGKLYSELGQNKKAIKDYNQALEIDSKFSAAYNNRGLLFYLQGNYPLALADLNQAIRFTPNYSEAYNNRGLLKKSKGETQEAIQDYEQAIQFNPKSTEAYNNLGLAKSELKDYPGALTAYNKSIEVSPTYPLPYYNRGNLKRIIWRQYQEALKDYEKALTLDPKFVKGYYGRGYTKELLKDLKGALADYNQLLLLDPKNSDGYNRRGTLKYTLGDLKGAVADLDKGIQISPTQAWVFANRGLARARLGDLKGGVADYDQAAKLDPKLGNVYHTRALIKKALGDLKGGIEDFTKDLVQNPKNAISYNERGVMKQKLEQDQEALADFKQALAIDPKFAYAWFNLGYSSQKLGDKDTAIIGYEKMMELKPMPSIGKTLVELTQTRLIERYRQKQYQKAKEDGLRFKKYAPKTHPKLKKVEQMLQEIEKVLSENKKE